MRKIFAKSARPVPLQWRMAGTLDLLLALGTIPGAVVPAYAYWSADPGALTAIVVGAVCLGVTLRFVVKLDEWAVSRHIQAKGGRLSRFIAERFWYTPLRYYSLNRVQKQLDEHRGRDELKRLRKERAEHKSPEAEVAIRDKRTMAYLARKTDPRKHLRAIVAVALLILGGIRMLGHSRDPAQALEFWQIGTRAAAYLFGLVWSAAHIDAWLSRKAAEADAKPFFMMSDRVLSRTPLRHLGRLLVERDYGKAQNIMRGRQTWRWRVRFAFYQRFPESTFRRWALRRVDNDRMEVTPSVAAALSEKDVAVRLLAMRRVVDRATEDDGLPSLPRWTDWKAAARDLLSRNRELAEKIVAAYRCYAEEVQQTERRTDGVQEH